MQFLQNHIAIYAASLKEQQVMLSPLKSQIFPIKMPNIAFGPNLSCLPNYLDNKYNFLKTGFVTLVYMTKYPHAKY